MVEDREGSPGKGGPLAPCRELPHCCMLQQAHGGGPHGQEGGLQHPEAVRGGDVCAATCISMCVCVGVNYTIFGFATEECLEICRCLLWFCKCLVLWGICFCCCSWSQMYNSLVTT